jgi:hypothetical protein
MKTKIIFTMLILSIISTSCSNENNEECYDIGNGSCINENNEFIEKNEIIDIQKQLEMDVDRLCGIVISKMPNLEAKSTYVEVNQTFDDLMVVIRVGDMCNIVTLKSIKELQLRQ